MTRTWRAILAVAAMAGSWAAPVCAAADAPATTDAVSVVATQPAPTSRAGLDEQKVLGGREGPGRSGGAWDDLRGIVQTFLALAVVLLLVLALRWGLGKLGRPGPWGGGPVRVLWRQDVGRHGQLLLVRLGERLVLVGAATGGMSVLAELHDPQEVQQMLSQLRQPPTKGKPHDQGDAKA